jgi:hypothetical protein
MISRLPFVLLAVLLACSAALGASNEVARLKSDVSQGDAAGPASRVQPATAPETVEGGAASEPGTPPGAPADSACVSCHRDLAGKLGTVVQEWSQSVHFRNNVSCDGCHGGDPAVRRDQCDSDEAFKNRSHQHRNLELSLVNRPEEQFTSTVRGRSVSYFCGRCHAQIKEKHLGSPHGDLGNPTCLYCHGQGSHAIVESKVEIIDLRPLSQGGRCAVCHRAATMETVARIYHTLVDAEAQLQSAADRYARLETFGYKNLALEKMYGHSRETLSQLRQSFHSFNMREINEAASTIKTNAQLTQETYDMIQALERAKGRQAFIGIGAVSFLLCFAALLLSYRNRYLH